MDVAFPYKEAITNAYGQPPRVATTAHVASQSLLYTLKEKAKQPKVNHSYFMVKQVFEAAHFDTPFNQIIEEAAEWK